MNWGVLDHSHHHGIMGSMPAADPLHIAGFAAIFSYSFLLSWHCAGMCGPLACSILGRKQRPAFHAGLFYNLGRCLSYVSAGLIFGYVGHSVGHISYDWGQILVRGAGVLLIVWALLPSRLWKGFFPDLSARWRPRLQTIVNSMSSSFQPFSLGLITIFLPCMTLHPLLLASAGSGSALHGGLTMLAFFLGTLPVMQTLLFFPALAAQRLPSRLTAIGGRLLLIIAGLITIARTLG